MARKRNDPPAAGLPARWEPPPGVEPPSAPRGGFALDRQAKSRAEKLGTLVENDLIVPNAEDRPTFMLFWRRPNDPNWRSWYVNNVRVTTPERALAAFKRFLLRCSDKPVGEIQVMVYPDSQGYSARMTIPEVDPFEDC